MYTEEVVSMFVRMYVGSSGMPPWQRTYTEDAVIDADQLKGAVAEDLLDKIGAVHGLIKINLKPTCVVIEVCHGRALPIFLNGKRLNGAPQALYAGHNLVDIGFEEHRLRLLLIGGCRIDDL